MTHLDLSNNLIKQIFADRLVEVCPNLLSFIIDNNQITQLEEFLPLSKIGIEELSFVGNPIGYVGSSRGLTLEFLMFHGF